MPSVEILTECVERPILYVRCDSHCANVLLKVFDATNEAQFELRAFITEANAQGWSIGLLGVMCPHHAAKARDAMTLIIAPLSGLIQ